MDEERRKPPCTVGGIVNWYSHYGKQYGGSLNNFKIELPYDPAILLLRMYSKVLKILTWKDICTLPPMFIAALFTISKAWKQLRNARMDGWVKKLWVYMCACTHSHTPIMEYYSAIKDEEILPFLPM